MPRDLIGFEVLQFVLVHIATPWEKTGGRGQPLRVDPAEHSNIIIF
jgi:hypothetical protein